LFFAVLGIKPRAWGMAGKGSITDYTPSSSFSFLIFLLLLFIYLFIFRQRNAMYPRLAYHDHPVSPSLYAGIIGTSHHTWPNIILYNSK
jgi:hypothetical protein